MTDYSKRDQLIDTISDVHKDIFGHRPRHLDWSTMSEKELEEYLQSLCEMPSII